MSYLEHMRSQEMIARLIAQAERSETLLARGKAEAIAKVESLIRERDEARALADNHGHYIQEIGERLSLRDEEIRRLRALLRTALTLFDEQQGGPCIEDTTCGHEDCEWYRRSVAALEGRDG